MKEAEDKKGKRIIKRNLKKAYKIIIFYKILI
jgi:hypothetical protein